MSFFDKIESGRVRKPLYMALYSGPGVGKCFKKGTPVLMHNGQIKEIQNIETGDLVMGPDSKPRLVKATTSGMDNLYRVSLKKGDYFVCNSRHDIVGSDKKYKPFKIEAKDFIDMPDNISIKYKLERTGVEFKEKKLDLDPYFVGVWLGDGNKDLSTLVISNPDKEIQKYLKKYSEDMGCGFVVRDGLTVSLRAYKKGEPMRKHSFKNKLKKFVVDGEKRIDDRYLINSRENRLQLLAGILDTDGHLVNKTFEVVSQYRKLAEQIVFLSKSLGFQATLKDKTVKGKIYYRVFISGETSLIPTKIKRKRAEKRKQIKSVLREQFKVTLEGRGRYYGIEVDGDHLFLLGNFVIVHNTSAAATFPNPHFFDFEESSHSLDVSRTRPTSWDEIYKDLMDIRDSQNPVDPIRKQTIQTLVFDTIDELERLIHAKVAESKGKQDIGDIGWQKGFDAAVNYWAKLISITRDIRDRHNMNIVFLAHSFSKSKTDLEKEAYFARYQMALHPKASDYIFGQVEMVLFAKKEIAFKTVDDKTFAKDLKTRVLCTSLSAYYDAKNRIGLPDTLPFPKDNMYQILKDAYEKAFNETPGTVLKECLLELKDIDAEKRAVIENDLKQYKDDISSLREALKHIKALKGSKR